MTIDAALLETLAHLQPLASLGPESLRELAPLCHRERVTRNLDPSSLKDWHGQVVYLTRGELKMDLADGSTMLIVGGSGDALMPLGHGGNVPVATKAITDIELLRFDEDTLDIVVTWDQLAAPGVANGNKEATDWRTMSGMFAAQNFVNGVFSALPAANIDALLGRFQRVVAKRGEVVIRQGDAGDYYYVVDRGRCVVTREVAGAKVELAELKGGDAFGEEALLADATRNATVTMKTDGVLLRLDKADFLALLKEPLLQKISPAQAVRHVAAGAVWIDTRFPAEYQHDGLPGALNIPLNEVREAAAMLEQGKEYIVYCQTGRRSSAAAFLLSQRGYRASLLDGGLKALLAEKGKIEA
ncbi:MAG: cyclic nucleotide-binding domain-containing protein [Rhodocyclaceae bacterium]|nr:cyclic nucleotide-binding domain-containing protein [Rhodocyclaceae bacterium]